jgi:hypothetical protein
MFTGLSRQGSDLTPVLDPCPIRRSRRNPKSHGTHCKPPPPPERTSWRSLLARLFNLTATPGLNTAMPSPCRVMSCQGIDVDCGTVKVPINPGGPAAGRSPKQTSITLSIT